MFFSTLSIVVLILGFGFVIFWHELGHFLAAKWAGVRVQQFAVGFGQAICSWRKGMGFRWGSSGKEYEAMQAAAAAGDTNISLGKLGETEYRLNWIPLGGYVMMAGQDDRPGHNEETDDPRAFRNKSIGKRMIIVSAGVIMNVLLAGLGFMAVFLMGFHVMPPVVGGVIPGSPAQQAQTLDHRPAPLQAGDTILRFNGRRIYDFTKIRLTTALSAADTPTRIEVRRADGQHQELWITPRAASSAGGMMALGIEAPAALRGLNPKLVTVTAEATDPKIHSSNELAIHPGDVVTAINGQPVHTEGKGNYAYPLFYNALQQADGQGVQLTIKGQDGQVRQARILPHFQPTFNGSEIDFGGMLTRCRVAYVQHDSQAYGKVLPDDVILRIWDKDEEIHNPSAGVLKTKLDAAGRHRAAVSFEVLRGDKKITIENVGLMKLSPDADGTTRYGMGIGLGFDERHAVVSAVQNGSPAAVAGIPAGMRIAAIDGQPVKSWFDVKQILEVVDPGQSIHITSMAGNTYAMKLDASEIQAIAGYNYAAGLRLDEKIKIRQTGNPLLAAAWGATETRDFLEQTYLTIQRMIQGSVPLKSISGPVGIFHAGFIFAWKGYDWLIWFLAMISANLAVVNFLPIPIVDGGLFLFLIIEKIRGKKLSPSAETFAQYLGLALILGVFLLVTYHDIHQWISR